MEIKFGRRLKSFIQFLYSWIQLIENSINNMRYNKGFTMAQNIKTIISRILCWTRSMRGHFVRLVAWIPQEHIGCVITSIIYVRIKVYCFDYVFWCTSIGDCTIGNWIMNKLCTFFAVWFWVNNEKFVNSSL